MFHPPIDAPHVWVALGLVGLAVLGLALEVPAAPVPDAGGVADTVDAVAASRHPTSAQHPLSAARVRLGPRRLSLRSDAGTAHAAFRYGPVTPATSGPLERVLRGAPPERVFRTVAAFREALADARAAAPRWQRAGDELVVRSVSWGDVDATLVGT